MRTTITRRARAALRGRPRARTLAAATLAAAAVGGALFTTHALHAFPQARIGAAADASSPNGDACTAPTTFQVHPEGLPSPALPQLIATVCVGGSPMQPTPRVEIDSYAGLFANDPCTLDIQLIDADGNVVTDHTASGCPAGTTAGDGYTFAFSSGANAPATGTFTAHARLTYQATTLDLGTSPVYTAGVHRCSGPGTGGIASGGDPATLSFDAGGVVVVELDSTDPVGTWVSAALGTDVNSGDEASSGISTINRPFYADFAQYGGTSIPWTISVGSTLGADTPVDDGPLGKGLLGGAGDIAWFVYSDYC